jgi:hypothetical protein
VAATAAKGRGVLSAERFAVAVVERADADDRLEEEEEADAAVVERFVAVVVVEDVVHVTATAAAVAAVGVA